MRRRSQLKKLFKSSVLLDKIHNNILCHRHSFTNQKQTEKVNLPYRHPRREQRNFTISAFDSAVLTYNQIESCRKVLTRNLGKFKRKAEYKPCVRFNIPCTSKSKNARMGKGKGGVHHFVSRVKMFDVLFFLRKVSLMCVLRIAKKMASKLPIKIGVVSDILKPRKYDSDRY